MGDGNDFDGSGGVLTISSDGVTATVMVDGNNFQVNPSDIRQWIIDHAMQGRQVVWNSPVTGGASAPRPGNGYYQWDVYSTEGQPDLSDSDRESLQEQSAQRWGAMLAAWKLFQQQLEQLGGLTDGDAIIGKIGDAIAACEMIELHDWAAPYTDEFAAWIGLGATSYTATSLQAAAQAVAQAGNTLIGQWRARMDQGNYNSYDLTAQQHAFVSAVTQARAQLVAAGN